MRSERSGKLTLAREGVVRAEEQLAYARRMSRKGYQSAMDVDDARLNLKRARLKFQTARDSLGLLNTYGSGRDLKEYEANARIAQDELARAKSDARIMNESRRISVVTAEQRLAHYEERLDLVEEALAACTIRAPRDGRVLWARTRSTRSTRTLEPGESVTQKQAVFEMPRFAEMIVEVRIPETKMRFIERGQTADVRVDAWPEATFSGEVLSIASVSTPETYPNYDRRSYVAKVSLQIDEAMAGELRPGLTAGVEIEAASVADAVRVPVQSVVEVDGRSVVFVQTDGGVEVRPVSVAVESVSHAGLESGVRPGESVVLSPRANLTEQLLRLWDEA